MCIISLFEIAPTPAGPASYQPRMKSLSYYLHIIAQQKIPHKIIFFVNAEKATQQKTVECSASKKKYVVGGLLLIIVVLIALDWFVFGGSIFGGDDDDSHGGEPKLSCSMMCCLLQQSSRYSMIKMF